jgi:hypothetical protein
MQINATSALQNFRLANMVYLLALSYAVYFKAASAQGWRYPLCLADFSARIPLRETTVPR